LALIKNSAVSGIALNAITSTLPCIKIVLRSGKLAEGDNSQRCLMSKFRFNLVAKGCPHGMGSPMS